MDKFDNNGYQDILYNLKEKIRQARQRTSLKVNYELLRIYWEIGDTILQQQKQQGWGAKIIDKLAMDLKTEFPDFKGLSVRNLKYMRAFAEAYPSFLTIVQPVVAQLGSADNEEKNQIQPEHTLINKDIKRSLVQPSVALIPWTHHTIILDKLKTAEERLFYIEKTIQNGWSKAILSMQIENGLYERQGKAITNFNERMPQPLSDLANETLKNPYLFDFISFSEEIKEKELETALISHLKKFMLELGRGFSYVGNQKNINVEGDDFFLDLLFYNFNLHCFVIFELKIGDFKPEFAGKLNFYVNTINEKMKGVDDKPTIGVLLCKTPNKTVIEYSLKGIESPIGVADYKLAKALPNELKGEMPSVEELEAEINKEYEELKSPSQKRFDALKQKLSSFKGSEIKQTATTEILFEIFDKSLLLLYESIIKSMESFGVFFVSKNYNWYGNGASANDINQLASFWKNEKFLNDNMEVFFNYQLNGFKQGGTEAFNVGFLLSFRIDVYWYGFILINYNNQQPFLKKLYHEQLTSKDVEEIIEILHNYIIDQIENNIDRIKK